MRLQRHPSKLPRKAQSMARFSSLAVLGSPVIPFVAAQKLLTSDRSFARYPAEKRAPRSNRTVREFFVRAPEASIDKFPSTSAKPIIPKTAPHVSAQTERSVPRRRSDAQLRT